jgi:hypothetical protein
MARMKMSGTAPGSSSTWEARSSFGRSERRDGDCLERGRDRGRIDRQPRRPIDEAGDGEDDERFLLLCEKEDRSMKFGPVPLDQAEAGFSVTT